MTTNLVFVVESSQIAQIARRSTQKHLGEAAGKSTLDRTGWRLEGVSAPRRVDRADLLPEMFQV